MKSSTFALASLLASTAIAQPHRQQHQHRAKHAKKDASGGVVWVTDWVTEIETVGYTTTIWVEPGFVPPTPAASQPSTTSEAAPVATQSTVAAQFFADASPASVYVAPSPSSVSVAPAVSSPVVSVPVAQSPTSVYVAPAPATSAAAPASSAALGVGTGPTTSACSSGSPCTGDFTYYQAGLGACGLTSDGSVDKVVALSHDMMGTSSNVGQGSDANSYCGKTITVTYGSKSVEAIVVDKCMGCAMYDVDLSNAAFDELADESLGRGTAKWYFN